MYRYNYYKSAMGNKIFHGPRTIAAKRRVFLDNAEFYEQSGILTQGVIMFSSNSD